MCSGSEAGSYLRLIDFVCHSTLGLRVIKKKKIPHLRAAKSRCENRSTRRIEFVGACGAPSELFEGLTASPMLNNFPEVRPVEAGQLANVQQRFFFFFTLVTGPRRSLSLLTTFLWQPPRSSAPFLWQLSRCLATFPMFDTVPDVQRLPCGRRTPEIGRTSGSRPRCHLTNPYQGKRPL